MNPPARPIRVELNDALVGGIRQRGADAVGLVIMGIAYLVVGVLALLVFLCAGSVFGVDLTVLPVTIMTFLSATISWLTGRSIRALFDSQGQGRQQGAQPGGEGSA